MGVTDFREVEIVQLRSDLDACKGLLRHYRRIAERGGGMDEEEARRIAREEIASLAGLVLSRVGDLSTGYVTTGQMASIFGEALSDFSGHTGLGEEPG